MCTANVWVLLINDQKNLRGFNPSWPHEVVESIGSLFLIRLCRRSDEKTKAGGLEGASSVSGKGNNVYANGVAFRRFSILIKGNNNYLYVDPTTRLVNGRLKIVGSNNHIVILSGWRISGALEVVGDGSYIRIGHKTIFTSSETRVIAQEDSVGVEIGRHSLIGQCLMRTSDSHSILDRNTRKRINPPSSISLGDRVWVALGLNILKGVELQNDVLVAAGSIVTKAIRESFCIIAGNPARVVKKDVWWDKERVGIPSAELD